MGEQGATFRPGGSVRQGQQAAAGLKPSKPAALEAETKPLWAVTGAPLLPVAKLLAQRSIDSLKGTAPLRPSDFQRPLTRELLHATHPEAADSLFTKPVVPTAGMFMRSFVGGYWADLSQIPRDRIPGGIGLCLGDSHPQNYGFLRIDGKTVIGFNDLDDSGIGPVALDAARYFSVLRSMIKDEKLIERAIAHYADVVRHRSHVKGLPRRFEPDWKHVQTHADAGVKDGKFQLDATTGQKQVPDDVQRGNARLIDTTEGLRGTKLLDAALLPRDHGGSAGLSRYRLLARQGRKKKTVIELKAAAGPGIERLGWVEPLSMNERLPLLKKAFWGSKDARDDFYVMLDGRRYLVRDRGAMKGIDPTVLGPHQQRRAILAEVEKMAEIHASAWGQVKRSEIFDWLEGTSRTIASRWRHAYGDIVT
jgi:hypothetical protein